MTKESHLKFIEEIRTIPLSSKLWRLDIINVPKLSKLLTSFLKKNIPVGLQVFKFNDKAQYRMDIDIYL